MIDYLLTQKIEGSQVSAVLETLNAWDQRAPAEAAARAAGFVNEEMRRLALKNVMSVWQARGPNAAMAWFEGHP
ncbi:MAG: hypothetical protein ACI8T1_000777 [Verrucomicrobiales bacterium]